MASYNSSHNVFWDSLTQREQEMICLFDAANPVDDDAAEQVMDV